tara:strand:- start:814 stop:1590 length:777 start_codon:yes stop_codon:yes gene_type:complete
MSNIVFMVNISEKKKPNRNSPYEYSIKSWKHYCKRHGAEFFMLTDRIHAENFMNANWHKAFVFQLLEASDIPYDKVLIVDGDTIVHPNAPSIFDACGDGFCTVHNDGSYDWLFRSMEAYSKLIFDDFTFPFTEYFNSGVMVVNAKHREFFNQVIEFYMEQHDRIKHLQETYHVGTDQPVLNFMVQKYRDDLEMLPYEWNMQDLSRREVLDMELTFTNYGWVYHFNAIPSNYKIDHTALTTPVQQWMQYTYDKLYGNTL